MERPVSAVGAPTKKGSLKYLKVAPPVAAAAAALLMGQHSSSAATLYWTGTTNGNWDDTSTDVNWNTTDAAPATTAWSDGNAAIFTDSFGSSGSASTTITINTTATTSNGVNPTSVTFSNDGGTSGNYTITDGAAGTGGITGTGSLTLASGYSGTVALSAASTFTGGVNVNGGTFRLGSGGYLPSTETINLGGGTLLTGSSPGTITQSVVAASGTTSAITTSGNVVYSGAISSGSGATATNTVLNLSNANVVSLGNLNGFTGTLNVSGNTSDIRLEYDSTNGPDSGSSTMILDFGAGTGEVQTYNGGGSGTTAFANATPIGALEGSGASNLEGASHSGSTVYQIGALGLSTTYAGTIGTSSNPISLEIVGGALTLTGHNTYTNVSGQAGTTIIGGSLFADNATASTGTGTVLVEGSSTAGFGTLGGNGAVTGAVTINSPTGTQAAFSQGAHVAPGSAGATSGSTVGTLALSGGLALDDYSNLDFTLGATNTAGNDLISTAALTLPADDTAGQDVQVNYTFSSGSPETGVPYTLIAYTSDTNGSDVADWNSSGLPAGYSVSYADTGTSITATFTAVAVPEPMSLGLVALGAGSMLLRRRRGPVNQRV